jgi:mRNA interferase MazF
MVAQGEVYWVDFGEPSGSEPGFRRPCVVVQNDAFNASRISTVVVAVITSNLRLRHAFGNVSLRRGEAGLPRSSVVNISQLTTIDKDQMTDRIGRLGARRFQAVLEGISGLLRPVDYVAL